MNDDAFDGTCIIRLESDAVVVDRADDAIAVSHQFYSLAEQGDLPAVSVVDDLLIVHGANRTVVYQLAPAEPTTLVREARLVYDHDRSAAR